MSLVDVAIIGAGIAGAGLAATIGRSKSTLLLEAEQYPGYHSTGRSAAFWSETYGGPAIQPLTTASFAYLKSPPSDFSPQGFLKKRGALHLGTQADKKAASDMLAEFANSPVSLKTVDEDGLDRILPGRRDPWNLAIWEADCQDIDVGGLHNAYLAAARRAGAQTVCNAKVLDLSYSEGHWSIDTTNGQYQARTIVNAAGAWADEVAGLAGVRSLGITPLRRTIMQLRITPQAPESLPLVVGLDGSFYFKPEAGGKLWLSPHDEIASMPCDAAPDELDIAIAIDRFEQVVDWKVEAIERKWAGLRSFAPDRLPIVGYSPDNAAFFWLAGQGGFGIQTAPAVSAIAATLLMNEEPDLPGVDWRRYLPDRFY